MPNQTDVVRQEAFAPVLYVLTYRIFDEALVLHNDVPHDLSSSIFARDQQEAERFLASDGSDCDIANVNIGTSGAEIGGAFLARKKPGAVANPDPTRVGPTCAAPPNAVNYCSTLTLAQNVNLL